MPEQLNNALLKRILNFTARGMRTEKEIYDKSTALLKKWAVDESEGAEAKEFCIKFVKDSGLVNDQKYASTYIDQNLNKPNPKSANSVMVFLMRKGIPRKLIDEYLLPVKSKIDKEAAQRIAEKKFKTLSKYDRGEARRRLTTYLGSKGYSFEVIRPIIDTLFKVA